ncbi:hypothetical protein [Mycolicibacterium fortuitum]|uniref:hypothetical protein n=1 Tax=Mycolicibacterium fortuitum TaxID=1766 RepID=UPI00260C1231|nr:hypothetical protein [Mycolicibacterium fortuitum]
MARAAQPIGAVVVKPAVSSGEHTTLEQAVHELYAEPSGHVVVAGPGRAQPCRAGAFAQ